MASQNQGTLRKSLNFLTEFSIPLLAGVVAALIWANIDMHSYHVVMETPFFSNLIILGKDINEVFGHPITFHFLMNDIFMVFFFGIAAVEITQAVMPGGSLNPITRAINPLLGTVGGVVGPAAVYFLLCYVLKVDEAVYNGWGIPTATDIALAWLVARFIFGNRHPAVSFLLLLAVADDAIGLGIIAVFYPDPAHPVELPFLLLTLLGMAVAFAMNKLNVRNFWLYIVIGGGLSWCGLIFAHLHPALALVFIVPFLPKTGASAHHDQMFKEELGDHSALTHFEHTFKTFVDFGLFGFGLANAGVAFSHINEVTWIVFSALLFGKLIGISGLSYLGHLLGFKLPDGMGLGTLVVASMVAGLGLTVALFVAGQAFPGGSIEQGAAKMGAVFSAAIALVAFVTGKLLRIKKIN